jgi:glycosyltransferase involved in cell wall biosynthesis
MSSSSERECSPSIRVLWLTKGLGRGGAERLVVSAAKRLDRSHFELEVAYLLPWKDALVPDLERLAVPVHCLSASHALDVRWISRLRRLVRQLKIDLVHTHMPYAALGARTISSPRLPIIHTEHNTWQTYRVATRWANRLTYSRNAAVIAVSHAVAASIRPAPFVRVWPPVHVIHHGAELSSACAPTPESRAWARTTLGLPPDALVVGSVGNFTPKKDHRTLLEATARLVWRHRGVRLVLVGSGPLERSLVDTARSLGLAERAVFLGSRDDVAELYPAFDVFALSSRTEGLPISLLEAMAAGVPCVATSVGGVPEVIHNGKDGLLVPAQAADALADALSTLLADSVLREGVGARAAQTARRFDITEAVHRIEEVYRETLHTSPSEAAGDRRA